MECGRVWESVFYSTTEFGMADLGAEREKGEKNHTKDNFLH